MMLCTNSTGERLRSERSRVSWSHTAASCAERCLALSCWNNQTSRENYHLDVSMCLKFKFTPLYEWPFQTYNQVTHPMENWYMLIPSQTLAVAPFTDSLDAFLIIGTNVNFLPQIRWNMDSADRRTSALLFFPSLTSSCPESSGVS